MPSEYERSTFADFLFLEGDDVPLPEAGAFTAEGQPDIVITAKISPETVFQGGDGGTYWFTNSTSPFLYYPEWRENNLEVGIYDYFLVQPFVSGGEGLLYTAPINTALAGLRQAVWRLTDLIGNTTSTEITLGTGSYRLSTLDLYAQWMAIDFLITKDIDYGENSAGRTSRLFDDSILSSIDGKALVDYAAWGEKGLNYLALHEVAHHTLIAEIFYRRVWQEFNDRGGNPEQWKSSAEFMRNEAFVNSIVKGIADHLNIPVLDFPPFGF